MKIIAFIEDPDVTKKILKHLRLWDVKRKPRPVANLHSVYGFLLDIAGWGMVPHQPRPNMLLLIPRRHTTLSTLIFCLIRSQKANSYLLIHYPCFDPTFSLLGNEDRPGAQRHDEAT
jgi:hypothetical protein